MIKQKAQIRNRTRLYCISAAVEGLAVYLNCSVVRRITLIIFWNLSSIGRRSVPRNQCIEKIFPVSPYTATGCESILYYTELNKILAVQK
jgi:hypothetical protein